MKEGCLRSPERKGLQQGSGVVRWAVHLRAHRVGDHLAGGVRTQEGLKALYLLDSGIEPRVIRTGRQDHGHPVGQEPEQVVRGGRQDRAGVDGGALGARPVLPQPGEREGAPVAEANGVGLLMTALFFHS